jgi:hypothetical protein
VSIRYLMMKRVPVAKNVVFLEVGVGASAVAVVV